MNKCLVGFTFFILIAAALSQNSYPTKYDFLNVDTVLHNKRLLKSYYRCLMDEGPCTQEGQDLRKILPDALNTKCKKCTPIQKKNARKVIEYIMRNNAEMWQGLLKKYDPNGKHTREVFDDLDVLV